MEKAFKEHLESTTEAFEHHSKGKTENPRCLTTVHHFFMVFVASGGHSEKQHGVQVAIGGQLESKKGVQVALGRQLGSQEGPSCSQEAPKRLQVAPKRLQVGSKRRPRGSKLASRGVQEAPSWLQEAPNGVRVERKSPSRNTWRAPGRLSKSIRRAKRENHDF